MFKSIKKTFQPDPKDVVEKELHQARLSLLEAETALEWATSQVEYNQRRIVRLERTLHDMQRIMPAGAFALPEQESLFQAQR